MMNCSPKKLKRINTKTTEKSSSSAQKKLRNENEKRRRDLFSRLINLLGEVILDKTSSTTDQLKLSKNAILRQTVHFLQQHQQNLTDEKRLSSDEISSQMSTLLEYSWKPSSDLLSVEEWFQISIESMRCFFLVLSCEKKIVYVSKNIHEYVGCCPDEMVNESVLKYLHPSEHQSFDEYFSSNPQTLAMCHSNWKQSLSDAYEECSIIGAFRKIRSNEIYFLSIVQIQSFDRNLVFTDNSCEDQFVTHLNQQGKFIYIDAKGKDVLGYQSSEFVGHSYFDFVHPDDLAIVKRAHQLWKANGNGLSDPHRFLTKGQQWLFIQTNTHTQINSWNGKVQFYVCTSNIIQCSTNLVCASINYSFPDDEQMSSSSSTSEITSFLSEIDNDSSRSRMKEKLLNLRQMKSQEIRIREDEIRVIDDILEYLHQYKSAQTTSSASEENLLNLFDLGQDFSVFNSPLSGAHLDDFNLLHFDSLTSIFSPITPFSNPSSTQNEQNQDINHLL